MNSYIYNCFKAFEQRNPEKARELVPVKKTISRYEPCEYCNHTTNYVLDNKFCRVMITRNALSIEDTIDSWVTGFGIKFCPMCGRKLE